MLAFLFPVLKTMPLSIHAPLIEIDHTVTYDVVIFFQSRL